MSISLRAFKYFFRSAQAWRQRRKPTILQLDTLIERVTRLDSANKQGVSYQEIAGVQCAVLGEEFKKDVCILYIHGGGFALCSLNSHFRFVKFICEECKACVVFPEYTKTPEAIYPFQLNECDAVFSSLRNNMRLNKIVLMGDSAGGNLATVITQRHFKLGNKLADKMVLLSPWQDLSGKILAEQTLNNDDVFGVAEVNEYARLYVGENDAALPEISPLFGEYPASVPTLLLSTTGELFHPIIAEFYKNSSSGNIQYIEQEGLFHVWPLFVGLIPEATRDAKLIADFVSEKN